MILILIIGLGLIGASIVLALRAAAGNASDRQALQHIGAYGFNATTAASDRRPHRRERLEALATSVGALYRKYAGEEKERETLERLRAAGLYRMRPATFVGYRILITAAVALFFLWLFSVGGALGVAAILVIPCFAVLGWTLPMFLLRKRAAQRMEKIDLEVPELVDLLVTTVEAGVGFAAALQITARRIEGPLGEELRVALSEQSMGLTIQEALKNMLSRANSPAMRVFVQAIVQGETLGVSIGKILRDLAGDMRKRRRQAAEERAQKAPTKIIFPLALLILPALFIVSVGPMVMSFIHGFG
jgi:tight adherence protein C